jgi:hypothetical protein
VPVLLNLIFEILSLAKHFEQTDLSPKNIAPQTPHL